MKLPTMIFLGMLLGALNGQAESPPARLNLTQIRQQALAQSPTLRQYQGRLGEARFSRNRRVPPTRFKTRMVG